MCVDREVPLMLADFRDPLGNHMRERGRLTSELFNGFVYVLMSRSFTH